MKKILCFGDSNTYGFNPLNGSRFSSSIRWSGILKEVLKEKYLVIEQGCNNRTCFSDNPISEEMTGYKAIKKYLSSDIDYLVLSLGINDLQISYDNSETDIVEGFSNLIEYVYSVKPDINILILSPSVLLNKILFSYFSVMFDNNSIEMSYKLNEILQKIAQRYNSDFINLNEFVSVSKIDGLHYDEAGHSAVAKLLHNYFVNLT